MDFSFVLEILPPLGTLGMTLFCAWFGKQLDRREKEREQRFQERHQEAEKVKELSYATALGLQSLLRNDIINLHKECVKNGYKKHYYDVQNMERMYDAYHKLGGNGLVTEIYDKFRNMDLIEERITDSELMPH